jgi:hypothetical protein
VVAALRKHAVEQVQLIHPPWFDHELDERRTSAARDSAPW